MVLFFICETLCCTLLQSTVDTGKLSGWGHMAISQQMQGSLKIFEINAER